MTQPGSITSKAPRGQAELVRRIEALERRVRENGAASSLQNSTVSQGGIQLVDGGTLKVVDSDGHIVAQVGALPAIYDRAGGVPQPGLVFYREDGSTAFALGDLNPTVPPFKQAAAFFDRAGNTVLADDTNSGVGLARPHLDSGGMHDTNTGTWPATTATTFTTIANKYYEVQNPLLTWQIQMFADAGITAQFRLLMNGTQIGTTQTVSAGTFGFWSAFANLPAGVSYSSVPLVELQAKTSAATASARGICLRFAGSQS